LLPDYISPFANKRRGTFHLIVIISKNISTKM